MAIDLSCWIGCNYCVNTCQAVNDVPEDAMRWNIVIPEQTELGLEFYMNRPCQHCQEAPCTRVCPVGATWVRSDGVVVMDYERCIGCRYCQVACPYDAAASTGRSRGGDNPYVPEWGSPEIERRPRGVVEKCTFCVQRIDRRPLRGLDPRCRPGCHPGLRGRLSDRGTHLRRYKRPGKPGLEISGRNSDLPAARRAGAPSPKSIT